MPFYAIVIPGQVFDECSFGKDEMNRAANPTVQIDGLLGTADIGDGAVTRCKLGISAFFYVGATGGPLAYIGTPCDGVNATNLEEGIWAVWKVPVDNQAGCTFKLGDLPARELYIDGKPIGDRYLKKDRLVACQYNSTLNAWEIHNINVPVKPWAGLATLVTEGAPGPLPPAPAGAERIWTSWRGWTSLASIITGFKNALFGLPASPFFNLRVNASGNDVEWARSFDYKSITPEQKSLPLSNGADLLNLDDPDEYQTFILEESVIFPPGISTIVCSVTFSQVETTTFAIKELNESGHVKLLSNVASLGVDYLMIRLDENRSFKHVIHRAGAVPATLTIKGYII